MYVFAKTVLAVGGRLNKMAAAIEKTVRDTAFMSFWSNRDAIYDLECVAELIGRRELLLRLKKLGTRAFGALCEEDRRVLKAGRKGGDGLYMSDRTFRRKYVAALGCFTENLTALGLGEEKFKRDYVDKIAFISTVYNKYLRYDKAIAARTKALSPKSPQGVYSLRNKEEIRIGEQNDSCVKIQA